MRAARLRHAASCACLAWLALPGGSGCASPASGELDARLLPPADAPPGGRIEWRTRAGSRIVVRVGSDPDGTLPPVLGASTTEADRVVFEPRFAFEPGLDYDVECVRKDGTSTHWTARWETDDTGPGAEVLAVYPSAELLPSNLLKFYVHFSAPMRRGEAYAHVELVGEDGQPRRDVLLELTPELWDPESRRITLLFDPGRIKSGLQPRAELGPTLEPDRSYELRIAASWPDERGCPLRAAFAKPFRTGPPDEVSPDPAKWRVHPPRAGTRAALVVELDEPLDRALLQRVILVRSAAGRELAGHCEVEGGEALWLWTPREPWQPGPFELVVDHVLEDRSGNSVGRPFEVDLRAAARSDGSLRPVVIAFDV